MKNELIACAVKPARMEQWTDPKAGTVETRHPSGVAQVVDVEYLQAQRKQLADELQVLTAALNARIAAIDGVLKALAENADKPPLKIEAWPV